MSSQFLLDVYLPMVPTLLSTNYLSWWTYWALVDHCPNPSVQVIKGQRRGYRDIHRYIGLQIVVVVHIGSR